MTEFVISINSSLISLRRYTRLRGGQVRNALRSVHPTPDSRNQQRLPKHLRQHNPAAAHSDRHQRYGKLNIGTSDTIVLDHRPGLSIGRAIIKVRGTRVAVGKQSAKIANARIIARNPRHRIRWTAPSQQGHHADAIEHSTLTTA